MSTDLSSNILIVDDIMENIQVVIDILHLDFPDLSFATSGQEALDILADGGIDLVLLDVMMPEMDGFEVCRRIKKDPNTSDIPVIFLTAKTDPDSLLEGFSAGGVDYLQKPFSADELIVRVETHLRLRRTEIGLRRLLAEKDSVVELVAHQVDGPFNGLLGMLRTLTKGLGDMPKEEIEEYLAMSLQAAEMVQALLQNLANWSKLQSGGLASRSRPQPLRDLMEGVVRLQETEIAKKGLRLELEVDPALVVHADPEVASRVMETLLANAVKYSSLNGMVKLAAEVKDGQARIMIQDHGPGIATGKIPGLFDPVRLLHRGEKTKTTHGVGLAMARALIENNGGALTIESSVGAGVTARIRLPLAQSE